MIGFVIYLIGCVIAFLVLNKQYKDCLSESTYCEDACTVYAFGTMMSWLTVAIYIYNKCFNRK